MNFCNKELIQLANISTRTYFRRLHELKVSKELIKKSKGNLYDYSEACVIASKLGFTFKFDKYVLEQQKK